MSVSGATSSRIIAFPSSQTGATVCPCTGLSLSAGAEAFPRPRNATVPRPMRLFPCTDPSPAGGRNSCCHHGEQHISQSSEDSVRMRFLRRLMHCQRVRAAPKPRQIQPNKDDSAEAAVGATVPKTRRPFPRDRSHALTELARGDRTGLPGILCCRHGEQHLSREVRRTPQEIFSTADVLSARLKQGPFPCCIARQCRGNC